MIDGFKTTSSTQEFEHMLHTYLVLHSKFPEVGVVTLLQLSGQGIDEFLTLVQPA